MTALPPSGSFAMVDPVHVAEVGPPAAILFARISWRCQAGQGWRATRRDLEAETGLTQSMLRTAVAVLRDRGWITSTRASADDATQVWSPVYAGQPDSVDSAPPPADFTPPPLRIPHDPPAESAISSYETGRDNYQDTHAAAGDVDQPAADQEPSPMPEPADTPTLFAVPDPTADEGPPKTAQTLVARWCDGYREQTGGDAPKAFMGRVAGQARNLAKACGEDHDEWVAAYHAAWSAGRQGQADMTRFLVQTRRPSTAPRNVFADPALGGPGADAMQRFSDYLGQTPRALGGPA